MIDDDIDTLNLESESEKYERILAEKLRRISWNCLDKDQKKLIDSKYDDIAKNTLSKIVLIFFSSLVTYYGMFLIIISLFIDNRIVSYNEIIGFSLLLSFCFIIVLLLSIKGKNFGKTQFLIHTLIYTMISSFSIIIFLVYRFPLTAYQIINVFIYIIIIQFIVLYISQIITKAVICKVDNDF